MKLLIDTELFLFRAAAAAEYEAEWAPGEWTYICRHEEAQAGFQGLIGELMDMAPDHQPVLVFGGMVSFRYGVWPSYKANRRTLRKPAGWAALTTWALLHAPSRGWDVFSLQDVEGDDALGLAARPGDIIASDDKDMLTLPGRLLRKGELLEISQDQADRNFYQQTLTGDAADGYPGCPGIGKVNAERLIDTANGPEEMWATTIHAFRKAGKSDHYALQMARCARILRPGEYDYETKTPILWNPPQWPRTTIPHLSTTSQAR